MRKLISFIFFLSVLICSCEQQVYDQSLEGKNESIDRNIIDGIYRVQPFDLENPKNLFVVSDYCSRTKACRTIKLPYGQHDILDNMSVTGEINFIAPQGTVLNLYPTDASKGAITIERVKSTYGSNVLFKGIEFVLKKPAKAVIDTRRSLKFRMLDCIVDGEFLANNGVVIGNETEQNAARSHLSFSDIKRIDGSGVHYLNIGSGHTLYQMHIRQNKIGVSGEANVTIVEQCKIENNQINNLDFTSGMKLFVSNSTFERGGVSIQNVRGLAFEGNRQTGGDIVLSNTEYASVEHNQITGSYIVGSDRIDVIGNYWQSPDAYQKFIDENCNSTNRIIGNYTRRGIIYEPCLN